MSVRTVTPLLLSEQLTVSNHLIASAFQSFMLGSGHPTAVPHWTRSFPVPTRLTSHKIMNTAGRKAWREDGPTGGRCLWEMHDVWRWDSNANEGIILKENYFIQDSMTGRKVTNFILLNLDFEFIRL